jgi:hypothetical protein
MNNSCLQNGKRVFASELGTPVKPDHVSPSRLAALTTFLARRLPTLKSFSTFTSDPKAELISKPVMGEIDINDFDSVFAFNPKYQFLRDKHREIAHVKDVLQGKTFYERLLEDASISRASMYIAKSRRLG